MNRRQLRVARTGLSSEELEVIASGDTVEEQQQRANTAKPAAPLANSVTVTTSTSSTTTAAPGSAYPQAPPAGAIVVHTNGAQDYVYKPVNVTSPYVPRLPDYSGNSLNLAGLQTTDPRAPVLVDVAPALPFLPGQYSREWALRQMSDPELLVRCWGPTQIAPAALTDARGWIRMPYDSPVFVMYPHFGPAMACYWRMSSIGQIGKPVMYYAVRKLLPLGPDPSSPFANGRDWEVFAAWCKPMKWGATRIVLPNQNTPAGAAVIQTDEGTEFVLDFETFRSSQDLRLLIVRNALTRSYPSLRTLFSTRTVLPPPEIVAEMTRNTAVFVNRERLRRAPPSNDDDNDDEDEDTPRRQRN